MGKSRCSFTRWVLYEKQGAHLKIVLTVEQKGRGERDEETTMDSKGSGSRNFLKIFYFLCFNCIVGYLILHLQCAF